MDKFIELSDTEKKFNFEQAAAGLNLPAVAVEKDFWVCWVLGKLFSDPEISPMILFKGGTSLSKVYNLIERFSEDIDLIMDWRLFTEDDPMAERTRTQQEVFNKKINQVAAEYLAGDFLRKVNDIIAPVASAEIDTRDPHVVNILYPTLFTDGYITPMIRLEAGPLASWVPNDEYKIHPYAADAIPDIFENPECKVKAIMAERTFWEKATILHQETHRPESKKPLPRYSRHYYDLYRMSKNQVKDLALQDMKLLEDVVEFKKKFYPCTWARYDLAKPGSFRLIPSEHLIKYLKDDYSKMQIMIFGEYPAFEDILEALSNLEKEING